MDSSRRAVEAYWRSRMVDGVTSDEDKVAPVYKLEEICELLRTSDMSIVKEISDYVFKRLDHKSPVVKQKTLRFIKYAVGKSGSEFRREMQRHAGAIRQLFHYKGQPDPLKGDALNKAVRETAHEAIAAIFASDDSKPAAPTEDLNRRIEGFGNTNFEMPAEDKKSFLSGVVGLGSASIKQGLSSITAAHSMKKNDNGSYKSPTLHRSLTREIDSRNRYEGDENHRESWASSGGSKNVYTGTWSQDSRTSMAGSGTTEVAGSSNTGVKSREERLLETIVTSGGVRLQPTRDAIQAFMLEAAKMDAMSMSHAIEMKLQSPLWQVRMKAMCVLESILRKKDDGPFSVVALYFIENMDSVIKCSELPQVSLREKATKVLGLLDGDHASERRHEDEVSDAKSVHVMPVHIPDLIDTGDLDDCGSGTSTQKQDDQGLENLMSSGSVVDDLFGSGPVGEMNAGKVSENDPFADVSFHTNEEKEQDIFSGMTVDNKQSVNEFKVPASSNSHSQLLDVFSISAEQPMQETELNKTNVHDLMAGLSLNGVAQDSKQHGAPGGAFSFIEGTGQQPSQLPVNGALHGMLGTNAFAPLGPMQFNMPHNFMYPQGFAAQPVNYGAMGSFIAQQQLLFHNLATLNSGIGHTSGNTNEGALPDIFHMSSNPVQSHGSMISSSKEETKAFDFISDHLSSVRDSKRVL